jgi:hypothetical protein
MITNELKLIIGLSIPLFILHGIEEYVTHFYNVDTHLQGVFSPLSGLTIHGATFVVFEVMFWLLLIVSFLLLLGPKWQLRAVALIGVVYLYELHHIYKAIMSEAYYSGLYTSLAFPILAFFFWKEWLRSVIQKV